jgi:hypothetical protein
MFSGKESRKAVIDGDRKKRNRKMIEKELEQEDKKK